MKDEQKKDPKPFFETETGQNYEIPEEGSLGLLAYGYLGLMAWRNKRRIVREEKTAGTK